MAKRMAPVTWMYWIFPHWLATKFLCDALFSMNGCLFVLEQGPTEQWPNVKMKCFCVCLHCMFPPKIGRNAKISWHKIFHSNTFFGIHLHIKNVNKCKLVNNLFFFIVLAINSPPFLLSNFPAPHFSRETLFPCLWRFSFPQTFVKCPKAHKKAQAFSSKCVFSSNKSAAPFSFIPNFIFHYLCHSRPLFSPRMAQMCATPLPPQSIQYPMCCSPHLGPRPPFSFCEAETFSAVPKT
jgi:hypothetical protein